MNFQRRLAEIAGFVRNHHYERTPDGILVPKCDALITGIFSTRTRGKTDWEDQRNIWTTQGFNYLLDQLMGGGASAPIYLSLYANAVTPVDTWDASTYPATAAEITTNPEGYTETARVQWIPASAVTKTKDNYASVAVFTIATAGTLSVNGIAAHTASAKGAITGKLISSSRFTPTKTFTNTDLFDARYRLSLANPA